MLARAEQDGGDREMHLVDEPCLEVLADRRDAAAQPHVFPAGRPDRLLERVMDAGGHEVKYSAPFHAQRFARVSGQHEHGRVIWRVLAPPAAPRLVGPGTADGAEHVAAEDPRANAVEAARGELVVDAGLSAGLAVHLVKRPSGEDPFVELLAADAEWILHVWCGPAP